MASTSCTHRYWSRAQWQMTVGAWRLLVLVLLLLAMARKAAACPGQCQCNNGQVRCQGVGLRMLPHGIPQHANVLDLQDNYINEQSFAPNQHGGLRTVMLQKLILENNQLRMLHSNVFSSVNGQQLMVLNLQNNGITQIAGGVFRNFVNLRILMIGNNRLQSIAPAAFHGLRSLGNLQMDQNFLTQLPVGLFSQTAQLMELGLSRNRLQALTGCQFSELTMLRDLELDYNALQRIDENAFAGLSSLQNMDLDHNRITTLQSCAFADLVSLVSLDIDHNHIQQVNPNAFVGLQSLQQLNIFRNRIATLPERVFSELPHLFFVDLSFNGIGRLSPSMFHDVSNLSLRLEGNRLQCDCNLLWLHWMAGGSQNQNSQNQNSQWNNNNNNNNNNNWWNNGNNNNNNNNNNNQHHQVEGGTCVSPPHLHGTNIDNAQIQCHLPPSVTIMPSQQAVRPGGTANFVCVKALRGYEVQWLHNGQPLVERHNMLITEGMLTVRRAMQHDAGVYTCTTGGLVEHTMPGIGMRMGMGMGPGMRPGMRPGMGMGPGMGGVPMGGGLGHFNNLQGPIQQLQVQKLQVQQVMRPGQAQGGSAARLIIRNARPASHMCAAATTTLQRPGRQRQAALLARCRAYSGPRSQPNLLGGNSGGDISFPGVAAPNLPGWSACPNCGRGSSARIRSNTYLLALSLAVIAWLTQLQCHLSSVT